MAYYSDPEFVAKMQAMRADGQRFGGPFASTRSAISQRYSAQRNAALQNTLGQQQAQFGYANAGAENARAWEGWGNRVQRAFTELTAREQINHQRRLAYEQQRANEKAQAMARPLAAIGGGVSGATAGYKVGGPWGAVAGGAIGSYAGYKSR
jgi:hypothetical protein